MLVYRINSLKYKSDISGTGAFINGGRWNNIETYMLYTSTHRSLALLEAMVHLKNNSVLQWYMLTIDLPIDEKLIVNLRVKQLSQNWVENENETKLIGDKFVKESSDLCLKVPSAIIYEEQNIIINTKHKFFNKVKIVETKLLNIDKRLI